MKVFKFGGASVKSADAIKNVADIISAYQNEQLLIVISALGKTTNALEEVVDYFYKRDNTSARNKIAEIRGNHFEIAEALISDSSNPLFGSMHDLFEKLESVRDTYPEEDYNMLYDQVVCFGELLSTSIVAAYLQSTGIKTHWLDVRTIVKTDEAYREAKIDWEVTKQLVLDTVPGLLENEIVLTQGFIGSTSNGFTTTLGREGSDFTASIFSHILDAEELAIWKDVPGVLNANPNLFKDVSKINELSYEEAIEMTYYGAQVIHPKTIKPLQNKMIPLHVRSFIDKRTPGTLITGKPVPKDIPPIIVYKKNQVYILFSTKDFSFMAEGNLGEIYEALAKLRIKTNIMQNGAISLAVCIDHNEQKLKELLDALEPHFNIAVAENVEVLTIRHFNDEIVEKLTKDKEILITQKTKETVQFVCTE